MKKLRSGKSLSIARQPQRAQGRDRFDLLLNVTEKLLAECPDTDVSLAMIAETAQVPLSSVYHFFPNRNAAYVELARRFHYELDQVARVPLDPLPDTWQEMMFVWQRRGRDYLNIHPAALRMFMGAGVSVEVRTLDLEGNMASGRRGAQELRRRFDCSGIPDLERHMAISLGILDGVWSVSYALHGNITDEYLHEGWLATTSYLRCYLPKYFRPLGDET